MVKRASIEFIEVDKPITEPVTKFGGQPVWVEEPLWPLSKSTGKPMLFICQIALDPELFGDILSKMAYLFMTDDGDEVYETWDPDEGENAVIIQPGDDPSVLTARYFDSGPSLYRMVKKLGHELLQPEPCEFAVQLQIREDPEFVPASELWGYVSEQTKWDEEARDRYYDQLEGGNKIGGTPGFMQGDAFPSGGEWKLLLQLDSTMVPFYVNFGDAGIGYAFISEDGRAGRFLWQCA